MFSLVNAPLNVPFVSFSAESETVFALSGEDFGA